MVVSFWKGPHQPHMAVVPHLGEVAATSCRIHDVIHRDTAALFDHLKKGDRMNPTSAGFSM
jgi:hypothetical protein